MAMSKCPIQFKINNLQIGVFSYFWNRSYPLYFVPLSKSPKLNGSAGRTLWDFHVLRDGGKQYKKNVSENVVCISRRCIFQLQKDFCLLYVMLF